LASAFRKQCSVFNLNRSFLCCLSNISHNSFPHKCCRSSLRRDLSQAVLSSQQTTLEKNVTDALLQRDAASQRFLRLHQQVPLSLALSHLPPSLDASQSLELRAEVASLETESNALRQQNRRLAARILQLQVTRASVLSIPFSCLIRFFPTVYSRRRKLPARTCLKKRCGCSRGWTRCRSSAGAPTPLSSRHPIKMSHQSFAVSFTVWCSI
jgi:hypothetical protein